ncbi:MAG: M56 family metallopeptidase, partial [Gemmataceae bacterium]
MSDFGLRTQLWLVQSLAASGLLLLLAACLLLAVRQPVRRRQIGSWAIRAALLLPFLVLAPSWLNVPLPARVFEQPAVAEKPKEMTPAPDPVEPGPAEQEAGPAFVFILPATPPAAEPAPSAPSSPEPAAAATPTRVTHEVPDTAIAAIAYGVIAGGLLVRWLLGYAALRRLVARAQEPDGRLEHLFAEQAGESKARLRITDRVRLPVCCGLWQPTVLLPASIARSAGDHTLRWVFAHELAHLQRGDPWTCFWFGLGQALFF